MFLRRLLKGPALSAALPAVGAGLQLGKSPEYPGSFFLPCPGRSNFKPGAGLISPSSICAGNEPGAVPIDLGAVDLFGEDLFGDQLAAAPAPAPPEAVAPKLPASGTQRKFPSITHKMQVLDACRYVHTRHRTPNEKKI